MNYWLGQTQLDPHQGAQRKQERETAESFERLRNEFPPLTAPPGRPATLSEQPLPHGRPLTQEEIAAHTHYGTGRPARATTSESAPDHTIQGALTTLGGLGEGALGLGLLFAPEPTGATKALAVALLLHSADTTVAGVLTFITGDIHETVEKKAISKAARAAGASTETADVTGVVGDASIGILLTFGAGASLWGTNYRATFGTATSTNYRATFFEAHPELKGDVVVHHAVEQQTLRLYPNAVTEEEIHSLENLRGIPKDVNSSVHLSAIRREWNAFYLENPTATQEQLLDKATEIDIKYGSQFTPKVGQ